MSAFRSLGSVLEKGGEPNIVANADAKVAKFFGINKKTPQKIAIKRHAKRDAAKIQQAWNARRIANIEESIKNGLLPKECLTGLSALKQEDPNARISFWQKTAARQAARTSQEIAAIKQRWAEKQLRDKEKALADLIPDVHGWHNTFSLAELQEAYGKIQSTLDYWKAKGYDLATDSNLHTLMAEVEQKIKFVEKPGAFKAGLKAHKTWQIQQVAYCELLDNVLSNPQKITCIIFENLFGPYFLPHQSHRYGYAPSSGENLTSKMSFKSDATYYFHITKESLKGSGRSMECGSLRVAPRSG